MKQIEDERIKALTNTNDDISFTEVATKPIEMESKIYNVTAKEDGPTWGNDNRTNSIVFFTFRNNCNNRIRNNDHRLFPLGHISNTMRDMLIQYPTTKNIWCHLTNTTRYRLMEFFLVILYHAIPGFIYDFVLQFTKNPRRLLPLYRKTHLFMVKSL